MSRYGYLDMPENYSDVNSTQIEAICPNCGRKWVTLREEAWEDENGQLLADCLCSESPIVNGDAIFMLENPENHHPECSCAICHYGQDQFLWAFHPSEY